MYTGPTIGKLVQKRSGCDNRRMSAQPRRGSTAPSNGRGAGARPDGTAVDKGLRTGAVGLVSSVVIGMASTAPAYSLAATLGFVVIAVGVKAPAIMLLAFVPMYCIAVAYSELNKREPDCGTTFTWAARTFGPRTGWLGGWGIIAADVIVMANLAAIAGSYGFQLFGLDGLADSTFWTTIAGVLWIAAMTYLCYRGLEISARVQYVLLSVEVVVLIAFAVYALFGVYSGSAPEGSLTPSLSWLWPSGLDWSSATEAVLLAIFIYWGWDTAVAINEESDDPGRTPGRAAIVSTLLLLATYAIVSIATVAFAGVGTHGIGLGNEANADDVFNAIGPAVFGSDVFGRVFETLLILSVLTSSAASTQTTILPTARATLSMGAYRALPRTFATVHPRYLSPSVSTIWMGCVSIAFYVGLTLVSDNVLQDSILAVGLLIAFYYGLTGFTCVWEFRRDLRTPRDVVMRFVIPLLGGLILVAVFVLACIEYADPEYGLTVLFGVGGAFVIGIGTLVLGAVLMTIYNVIAPAYFRGETLREDVGETEPAASAAPPPSRS
jgi:amino acid transporter